MDETVRKELETLKGMVLTWKGSYLGWAPPDGGGEFLAQEFLEEIDTLVYPYVRRLYDCDYLSQAEVNEFLDFCYSQAEELRNVLKEAEAGQDHTI
ncbi:MAG: hypothetical protein ACE5LU_06025 [Anaerolineae bacterium]